MDMTHTEELQKKALEEGVSSVDIYIDILLRDTHEVEAILKMRVQDNVPQFLVKWKGYEEYLYLITFD